MAKRKNDWIQLSFLHVGDDFTLLLLRLLTGTFLIDGVWDNVTSQERMQEFIGFLQANHFLYPQWMAPLSVWVQLICGICFIFGVLTRWAGLLCTFNFIVACIMVHWHQDFRAWWPAIVLVAIGLVFATRGAGKFSVDRLLRRTDS